MAESAIGLEEVVVTGYGTRQKGELTGSISNIKGASLERSSQQDLGKSLQGEMPGLIIVDRGGEPGQEISDMLIRGKRTLGNNSPLIIIDGTPEESFGHLSPGDIDQISVLKDASAAIYGARAANGVIVIRTKRGKEGKSNIRLASSYGVSSFTRVPEAVDSWQFATYEDEVANRFGTIMPYSQEDIQKYKSGSDPLNYPNTHWFNEVFKKLAPETHENLSVSGGSKNIQYFISGDYVHQGSNYHGGDKYYDQQQIRSNIDIQPVKYLNIGLDLYGRYEKRHSVGSEGAMWSYIYRTYPTIPAYYSGNRAVYAGEGGANPAVISTDEAGYSESINMRYKAKLSFALDMDWITKGLVLSGYDNIDLENDKSTSLQIPYTAWMYDPIKDEYSEAIAFDTGLGNRTALGKIRSDNHIGLYHIALNYKRSFGNHNFDAFVAGEQSSSLFDQMEGDRYDIYSSQKPELFAGIETGRVITGYSSESGRVNYFGNISYNYMGKYLLEFTLRRDGSFNFAQNKRFGTFPGISAAWVISKEPFMVGTSSWLNSLKFRVSYAQMGNDVVPGFQYLTQYNIGGSYDTGGGHTFFGVTPTYYEGMYSSNTPNPDITWEVSKNQNVGFDANLWNGMLSMGVDYFYEKRDRILIARSLSVPQYTALELPDENLGKVDNSGIELQLNHQNKVGDITYNVSANFTYAHNKIIYMDEAKNIPDYRKQEGHSLDSWVVYEADGIFSNQTEIQNYPHLEGSQPGDIKYVDVNGDGIINDNDMVRQYSSPVPEIQYGINLGIQYKGFELNVLFQGQAKATTYLDYGYREGDYNTYPKFIFEQRWTEDNQNAKYPRIFQDGGDAYAKPSTLNLNNASFIRLKDLELAYNFSSRKWMPDIFKELRIYLKGSNLLTLDHIKYYDPEINNVQSMYYPQKTTITAGINVEF